VSSGTCIHGFPPDGCLICQTLQQSPTRTKDRPAARAPVAVARPDAVIAAPARRGSRVPVSLRVGGVLLMLALVAMAVFFVVGIVYAALRLFELVAAALVAGWAGWKLGVHHGRSQARREARQQGRG
jgi:hypothetical protein